MANANDNLLSPLASEEPLTYKRLIPAHIVSQTPGRIRLRVGDSHRQKDKLEPIIAALTQELAIYRVRIQITSGSITVFHSQDHINCDDIRQMLEDLGIIWVNIASKAANPSQSTSNIAAQIIEVAANLNQRFSSATQGKVDLRLLLPLSFSLLALRQLVVKGWQLELIPWYVLAWYAFDSFIKLHTLDESGRSEKRVRVGGNHGGITPTVV